MKVGIVTLPLHTNYGGILQAWALQTVIERMGHESSHVFRDLLGPLILYKDMSPAEIAAFQRHTARFIGRYIRCDGTPLKDISPDRYDALVVGSDQIWRNRYTEFFHIGLRNAFLDFAKGWNVRRVAYAPSFGIDSWEAAETEIPACSELLRKFDAVSCREASGAAICRDVLGVEARTVADPTLLLGPDDYGRLVDAGETEPPPGDLMVYVLDRDAEKDRLVASVAARFALRPFLMNDHPEGECSRVQPAVEQWLRGIRDSRLVVTDSFHATVFSILFRRPFIVTGNPKRGLSRIESLLSRLGLERHLVTSPEGLDPSFGYAIPDSVHERLAEFRAEGIGFLSDALS